MSANTLGMRFKVGAIVAVFCIAASAQANGAMGLGLEMWDLRYWFAYVVAIIALEAWLIGRWLKISWFKCILISVLANSITGSLCSVWNPLASLLHWNIVGSQTNPSPFPNAIALLTLFAIPSGWVESVIWRWAAKTNDVWPFVKHVLMVHLITVPVGLVILLIPEHPYRGLEATTDYSRRRDVMRVEQALQDYVMVNESLPKSNAVKGIASELAEFAMNRDEHELALTFYVPELTRFNTGERWEHPFEVNPDLVGKHLDTEYGGVGEEDWVWYIRRPDTGIGYGWGFVVDVNSWNIKFEHDFEKLYGP